MTTIAAESFGPSRATLSLARASSLACSRASMDSRISLDCLSAATASSAAWAANAGDLPQLGGQRALPARLDQSRDLHGQRRTAGHDVAANQPLPGRAHKRARVDAAMLIEPPVLIGDKHRQIARIDVMRRRRQAPAPVRQGEGPEQPSLAIDDDGRALARGQEVDRPEARRLPRPANRRGEAGDEEERDRGGKREEGGASETQSGHSGARLRLLVMPAKAGIQPSAKINGAGK